MDGSQASKRSIVGSVVADRFQVVRKLAAGGMGVVYLAEQVPLGRQVALKILDTKQLDEERAKNFGERFFLEAAAVAKLVHPNTITIYDYGKADEDTYFYAMEYVDGASMRDLVRERGPLSPAAVIHIGLQICGSLREAHRVGMIHRDLKPGNIMLTERHDDPHFAKVLDFGLVKVMGDGEVDTSDLTASGILLGSPRYMAPEQVLRFEIDSRCDIYSLGGVLYFALTGRPPFTYESQFEVLRAHCEELPPTLQEALPGCEATAQLEALVMSLLEKERADRPQDMTAVAEALVVCAREIGLEEPSISAAARIPSNPSVSVPPELRDDAAVSSSHVRAASRSMSSASQAAPVAASHSMQASAAAPSKDKGMGGVIFAALALIALLAAGAGVFAAVAFLVPHEPEAAAVAEPPPAPAAPEPEPPAATEPEAPATGRVQIETVPPGARVRRGDVDLGDAPFTLEIPEGEQWELTVSLADHETRTVLATSGRDVLRVHLTETEADEEPGNDDTVQARRPTPQRPPTPQPQPLVQPSTPTPTPQPDRFESHGDLRHPWAR